MNACQKFEVCVFTVIDSKTYISGSYQIVIKGSDLGTFLKACRCFQ